MVRTALDIDDDALLAAKEIAAAGNVTAGTQTSGGAHLKQIVMNGLRVIAPTGKSLTSEMVQELREAGV